ncbi:hypothetical protein BJ508DRAFT_348460 [Ascobolus immersus RN42]|uniref:G-patch domain-containing protein n=1 Tax=Ascobolus immersus RN42 TaxID=1160509 RepID=A0A3N4HZ51_ASCIM|nr:hypothetical protein BJ508DRAFT_348460 [Ascobolus immersus RN42]
MSYPSRGFVLGPRPQSYWPEGTTSAHLRRAPSQPKTKIACRAKKRLKLSSDSESSTNESTAAAAKPEVLSPPTASPTTFRAPTLSSPSSGPPPPIPYASRPVLVGYQVEEHPVPSIPSPVQLIHKEKDKKKEDDDDDGDGFYPSLDSVQNMHLDRIPFVPAGTFTVAVEDDDRRLDQEPGLFGGDANQEESIAKLSGEDWMQASRTLGYQVGTGLGMNNDGLIKPIEMVYRASSDVSGVSCPEDFEGKEKWEEEEAELAEYHHLEQFPDWTDDEKYNY